MSEKIQIDSELKKEWEDKLSEFGLGEELPRDVKIPQESSTEHLLSDELLSRFSVLPGKIQEDILTDVKDRHSAGESFDDICRRTEELIAHAEELLEMKVSEDSSEKDDQEENEVDENSTDTDKFITKMEGLISRNKKETIH